MASVRPWVFELIEIGIMVRAEEHAIETVDKEKGIRGGSVGSGGLRLSSGQGELTRG